MNDRRKYTELEAWDSGAPDSLEGRKEEKPVTGSQGTQAWGEGAHEECLYTLPCTTGTGQHSLQVSAQVTVCRRHWDMFPESLVVTHTELLGAEN